MSPESPLVETFAPPEDQARLHTRGALARLTAERLTPVRIAMVQAALDAFDVDSYGLLTEL